MSSTTCKTHTHANSLSLSLPHHRNTLLPPLHTRYYHHHHHTITINPSATAALSPSLSRLPKKHRLYLRRLLHYIDLPPPTHPTAIHFLSPLVPSFPSTTSFSFRSKKEPRQRPPQHRGRPPRPQQCSPENVCYLREAQVSSSTLPHCIFTSGLRFIRAASGKNLHRQDLADSASTGHARDVT